MNYETSILSTVAFLTTLNIFAQGTYQGAVEFSNMDSGERIIGTDGQPMSGAAWRVALYWGHPTTTDDRNLIQIGNSAAFLTGQNAGYFNNLGRTITYSDTVAPYNGATLAFQIRAWCSGGGTLLSWEQAVAAHGPAGKSSVFMLDTADPNNPFETKPKVSDAPGSQGFALLSGLPCVPEPSTITLCILGAAGLFLLRRRK